MVCDSTKITGMAAAAEELRLQIGADETRKAEQDQFCNSTFDAYEATCASFTTASRTAHYSDLTLQQKKQELERLQQEMQEKIRNATNDADVEAIKTYYEPLISGLEREIYTFEKDNKKLNTEYTDATKLKQQKKFSWMGATNDFLQICRTLFDNYITLGKFERSAYLEDHFINKTGKIDYIS